MTDETFNVQWTDPDSGLTLVWLGVSQEAANWAEREEPGYGLIMARLGRPDQIVSTSDDLEDD